VNSVQFDFDSVLILADESADWNVAGLRQLDRLALALNEFAEATRPGARIDIFIWWKPAIPAELRRAREHRRLSGIAIAEGISHEHANRPVVLMTRLLPARRGLAQFLADAERTHVDPGIDDAAAWSRLAADLQAACRSVPERETKDRWRYLAEKNQIAECERWLLQRSCKRDDGLVSRYLNRPLSRAVSRVLVKTHLTPNGWTLFILVFPVAACVFLSRGTYAGFVIGAVLYQLHSILDGCDGEIARAKYLDSKKGPGVDALGDLIGLLLFTLGLGLGLFQMTSAPALRWVFLGESILSFGLIANRLGRHTLDLLERGPAAVLSSEHDQLLRESGKRFFGSRLTSLLFNMTKRDVVYFAFLILAIFGLARWILHLLFAYSLGSSLLVSKGRRMRRAGGGST